jgi:hypothetical protein
LQKEPDLDALRARADFQSLIKELQAREDPSRPTPP